jgi:hypothetical protein
MRRSFAFCVTGLLIVELFVVASSACSTTSPSTDAATDGPALGDAETINEPFNGVIGCDGGGVQVSGDCALTLPLTGAVSGTFTTWSDCTSVPGSVDAGLQESVSWDEKLGSATVLELSLDFNPQSLPPDELGTFPLLDLQLGQSTDAGARQWTASSCSITIMGSVCSPTLAHPHRRVISGTGTCSQPAVEVLPPGNPDGPVTIGAFDLVGFIDPP